eukprot:5301162-Amphidinium_carterae.2
MAIVLANEGFAEHGPLEPEETWVRWTDFANKVFHFWRLVGPRLRDEPRIRLPREPVVEEPENPLRGMVFPEAPFQLGQHLRVVRHADFLQCLDCNRQTGKVKRKYNFAYLTRQSCRTLKKRKKKKRRTGFAAAVARVTGPAASPPPGGATGSR